MILLVVQSRLNSTRLPGKALLPLGDGVVLDWVFSSMKKVNADRFFLATDFGSKEKLEPVALRNDFECFAGPENDVLKRFCLLIEETKADIVVRVTGDNPFLFFDAANQSIVEFKKRKCDYFTFSGLPHGSGIEIFNAKSLLKAEKLTDLPYDREHVGPSLYNHQDVFSAVFEKAPKEWFFPQLRTTIDTKEDYKKALFMAENLKKGATSKDIVQRAFIAEKKVLLVPSVKEGHGTGHLRRCLSIAQNLFCDLYIPQNANLQNWQELTKDFCQNRIIRDLPTEKGEYNLIVTDCFSFEKDEIDSFAKIAPIASIDEGSTFTESCDYLLDIIPSTKYNRKPNTKQISFIPLPQKRRSDFPKKIEKVLIAIGGEDPANLTFKTAEVFSGLGFSVTAVSEKAKTYTPLKGVHFETLIENLKERLCSFDLVVTHYGFTAFEAVAAKCAVLLLGTTELHFELAKSFGFEVLEKDLITETCIKEKISDINNLFAKSDEMKQLISTEKSENIETFVKKLSYGTKIPCPICGDTGENDFVFVRLRERTIRKCKKCGMLYLGFSLAPEKEYSESYFFDEYKNQYGKTYLEDFESIKTQGLRRSSRIDELFWKLNKTSKKNKTFFPSILDIGCAYGPFLSAVNDCGWKAFGTDISDEAVEYVKNSLNFNAVQSSFPDFDSKKAFGVEKFNAVSMWFVIEHFKELKSVLQKVSDLLPVGGIFAFSTPSASGVSAVFNTKTFYEQSPTDHFTLWQPETAPLILEQFGFKVVKIVSTGIHPERFPFYRKHKIKQGSFVFRMLKLYSKISKLGDTFEVYCVKEK